MKKHYIFYLLLFVPVFARASVFLYTYDNSNNAVGREIPITNKGYGLDSIDYSNEVFSIYFNNFNGYYHTRRGFLGPIETVDMPTNGPSASINYQILVAPLTYANPLYFPRVATLYNTVESLYIAGYRSPGLCVVSETAYTHYVNFNFSLIVSDILSSTNNAYQSIVLSTLNSIYSHVQGINTGIQNINVDLGQFQTDYKTVNFGVLNISNYIDSAAADGVISPSQADIYKGDIASAISNPDVWGDPSLFARSVYDNIEAIKHIIQSTNALNDRPSALNEFAKQFGNSFSAAGAGHFTTPLTNEMQRMNTNWVQETKAALSNNTQKIKDDLQAWKDQLSGPNGSQAAIVSALNGAMNNTGAFKVELQNANNSVYVHLDGPITLDSAQFQDVNNKLQANFDIFHDWVYEIPESWVRYFNMFRENTASVLTNQSEQISLLSSLTNLLFDYTLNFTSNTMFAISNSFAGITATNDYMLLSDYADYINSSGLSDLLGVLDDDSYSGLKDELLSIGADDVSAGYGRWWRYFTGLSTIQANSVFNIANLLLDHEKLLKDLKRDNTDVVELSDSNVFADLLSKIPSQTHIDNKISELTNSIDQSGFVRIRELIPDLTNRLSVASALYDHDFALPTDISWVLIPADSHLNIQERVVHISPSEHYRVFQVLHYGIAFSYCIVNLILLPKFLLLLVRLFDRVWNKSERLIYNSTQS